MNIDFHVHGIMSKKMEFDEAVFLQGVEYAKASGLDAFVMCEHFNAMDFLKIYNFLKDNFLYKDNRYIINDFSIFPALEVNVKNKGHVIICSGRDEIFEIRKILEKNMEKDNFITFEELLNLSDNYECLKIGAHPYRKGQKLYLHPNNILKRLDALDLNAKDIYKKGIINAMEEINNLSGIIGVNVITGSDSHFPIQLGCVKTKLNKYCCTIKEIKECIINNDYEISICESLELKVFSAKVIKKHLSTCKECKHNV